MLETIKDKVRIVLIIGPFDSHLGLVEAVEEVGEFEKNSMYSCSTGSTKLNSNYISERTTQILVEDFFVIGISAQLEYDQEGETFSN